METGTQEKLERWKLLAEQYLEDNKIVYAKDFDNNIYFGYVLFPGERQITLECTGPQQRAGQKISIEWLRVTKFEEANK